MTLLQQYICLRYIKHVFLYPVKVNKTFTYWAYNIIFINIFYEYSYIQNISVILIFFFVTFTYCTDVRST